MKIISYSLLAIISISIVWLWSDRYSKTDQLSQSTSYETSQDRFDDVSAQPISIAPDSSIHQAEVKALKNQLAVLKNDVAKIVQQIDSNSSHARIEATQEQPADSEKTWPLSTATDHDEIKSRTINSFEERIYAEPVDEQWSNWVQNEIIASLNDDEFEGVVLEDSQCHSTLCRIELSYADEQDFDKGLNALSVAVPWDAEGYFYIDENEPDRLIAFVAREGELLHPTLTQKY